MIVNPTTPHTICNRGRALFLFAMTHLAKYIDADRLKVEINETINEIVADALDPDAGIETVASAKYKKDTLSDVLNMIDSLQQEQPDSPSLIKRSIVWFENIAVNAKRLSAGNVSHLGPTIVGMAIRSKEFLEKHQEEQLEVDLEKEIGTYFQGWTDCDDYS